MNGYLRFQPKSYGWCNPFFSKHTHGLDAEHGKELYAVPVEERDELWQIFYDCALGMQDAK